MSKPLDQRKEQLANGFGKRLTEALRQRGVRKLYPLALELGVDESALSRWRKGGSISLENAIRLCLHLDISLDWLLTGRSSMDGHRAALQLTVEEQRILLALQRTRDHLSPRSFTLLVEFLHSM